MDWVGGRGWAGVGWAPFLQGAKAGSALDPPLLVGGPGHADMPLAAGLGTR